MIAEYNVEILLLFLCHLHRFVTGVITRDKLHTFERVLWRACRGNVFLRQAEIVEPLEDPITVRYIMIELTKKFMIYWLCSATTLIILGMRCHQNVFSTLFTGKPPAQTRLHPVLPRRSAS